MWHGKNQNNGKSNVFNIVHFRAKNIAFEGIFKNDHENNEFKKQSSPQRFVASWIFNNNHDNNLITMYELMCWAVIIYCY